MSRFLWFTVYIVSHCNDEASIWW